MRWVLLKCISPVDDLEEFMIVKARLPDWIDADRIIYPKSVDANETVGGFFKARFIKIGEYDDDMD